MGGVTLKIIINTSLIIMLIITITLNFMYDADWLYLAMAIVLFIWQVPQFQQSKSRTNKYLAITFLILGIFFVFMKLIGWN